MLDKFNRKIFEYKDSDIFILFYSPWCQYSKNAIELLKMKGLPFKGYNIDNIKGNIDKILYYLSKNKNATDFDDTHRTRPIIFHKGKFIGGYTDLVKYLDE